MSIQDYLSPKMVMVVVGGSTITFAAHKACPDSMIFYVCALRLVMMPIKLEYLQLIRMY